jgi:hypothetical protein
MAKVVCLGTPAGSGFRFAASMQACALTDGEYQSSSGRSAIGAYQHHFRQCQDDGQGDAILGHSSAPFLTRIRETVAI